MRHFLGRILHSLMLLLGVSVLSFLFSELAPGDYLDDLRLDPRISPEALQGMRERLGLDRSLPERYLSWLASVARGEFGYSVSHGGPVGPILLARARNTLLLTVTATFLAWLLGLPLGIWIAWRRGGAVDRLAGGASAVLLSVPEVLLGLGALLLAVRTGWLPPGGLRSVGWQELTAWGRLIDLVRHLVLPALALALAMLPVILRHVRSALLDVLGAPYLRVAEGRGVPRRRLLFRHALRSASNPLISLLGLSIAGLLSGSLLIEVIMAWPGIGLLMRDAIYARDLHLVLGVVLLSSVFLIFGNLIADLLLAWSDPRVRRE